MITIEYNPTASTNMRPNAKRFFDDRATVGTFLAAEMWGDCNYRDIVSSPVVVQPADEGSPSCIMDRFGEFAVAYHIPDLKVFIGNQVARRDILACHLSGKILTLPLNFQMLLGQAFLGLLPVSRLLLFVGEAPLEASQLLFSFPVVSGVLNGIAFRVSQVCLESNINTKLFACWNVLDFALDIDAELHIVSICSSDDTNTLDLLDREFLDALIGIPNELEPTYPTAICEDDMTAIGVQLPPTRFVLDTPVVVLKLGISLLSRFLVLAILIEAGDGKPRTFSRSLTGHGIESRGEGVFLGKHFAVSIQVVLVGPWIVHPQVQAFVTDELDGPNGLIDGSILLLAPIQLVFVDQHCHFLIYVLF